MLFFILLNKLVRKFIDLQNRICIYTKFEWFGGQYYKNILSQFKEDPSETGTLHEFEDLLRGRPQMTLHNFRRFFTPS